MNKNKEKFEKMLEEACKIYSENEFKKSKEKEKKKNTKKKK